MEALIISIIQQEGRIHDLTIYFSILIAYLEQTKWLEAKKIIDLLEENELDTDEAKALAYLSVLWELEDIEKIASLTLSLSLAKC